MLYRWALGISIALNVAVGVFLLFDPEAFAALLGQPRPTPATWPRHWGAQLIAINLLYLPGWFDPVGQRFINYLGVAIRLAFAAFFFTQGQGFAAMGVYDAAFGILLLATYRRVRTTRPPDDGIAHFAGSR